MIPFSITLIYSQLLFAMMMPQEFDTRWDEILLSMTKIPTDDVLESLNKLRKRDSHQLKTVLNFFRHGNSSEDIGSQLSEFDDDCEDKHRSETQI